MRKYNMLFEAAHMRDDKGNIYTGEPLLLAVLMKARGKKRGAEEEQIVSRLMKDINLDE